MAWDSKTSRRRQNSGAASKLSTGQIRSRSVSNVAVEPKSAHVADPALLPFLHPSFDSAEYLNSTLPQLQQSPTSYGSGEAVPLAELSTQTQTLLSQLSAHTTRLTNTLTQLTDEILRSGSRLAYEVEVLRGETLGLSEALTENLQDDIQRFVPGGISQEAIRKDSRAIEANGNRRRQSLDSPGEKEATTATISDPPYITQLRTLTLVRSRLDAVIKTFGDAMAWTFPPSEVSVGSSFLSVSAPDPGSDTHSTEEKGQQVSKQLRDEIMELLASDNAIEGIEAAAKRVEGLKELTIVWKGTAEEKARIKFVESLARMVEDRHKDLLREAEQDDRFALKVEPEQDISDITSEEAKPQAQSVYGFISRLQKMREGL
ncbi:hypothetical protein F5884DRAFT_32623 [Xylogone sp. PMI_703]|nr:hypothetical protein F5884DRAFT_32623 [Xylogone sp. PMI_703]